MVIMSYTVSRKDPEWMLQKDINIKKYPIDDNHTKKIEKYEDDLEIRKNVTVELVLCSLYVSVNYKKMYSQNLR
jgi:hypothetical protein